MENDVVLDSLFGEVVVYGWFRELPRRFFTLSAANGPRSFLDNNGVPLDRQTSNLCGAALSFVSRPLGNLRSVTRATTRQVV